MDYRQALRETMFRYGIKVVDLAPKAKVKQTQLSAFRTGKRDLYASTLEQVVNAMPSEAQAYFYELLRRSAIAPDASVKNLITSESYTEREFTPPPCARDRKLNNDYQLV
jgi:predicted transcriptional regulator